MTLAFFLLGCPWVGNAQYVEVRDVDGDGGISDRFGGRDCQDDNPEIADCDADRDGAISALAGGDDCDDTRRDVNPAAVEVCDGADNDCDGAIDNDDTDTVGGSFFADTDGDGDGDLQRPAACRVVGLHVTNSDDCDDLDAAVHTGADELCDGFDNNCDGIVDDAGLWSVDADGDGFGNPTLQANGPCILTAADGLAANGLDCDDDDASVHPDAPEVPYDSVDDNCNGGQDNWDVDLDDHVPDLHWALAQAQNLQLPASERWPIAQGDCDDTNPARFVGNPEICDTLDNDCDGLIDTEDLGDPGTEPTLETQVLTLFTDVDGDGHPGTATRLCPYAVQSSDAPTASDCDDTNASIHPDATEVCDLADNDCDGRSDWSPLGFPGSSAHFRDVDGDGFGDAPVHACAADPVARLVALDGDCNDSDAATHPGADELCGDTVRQDCGSASVWDCDADGQEGAYFGNGTGEDCDDQHPGVYTTDAPLFEICDGIDNDCDGDIDTEDTDNLDQTHLPFWISDADGDGFGPDSDPGVQQCEAPDDHATVFAGDCDDADPELNPDTRWYADLDEDGFGVFTQVSEPSCTPPAGAWSRVPGDCNDSNPDFHPDVVWLPDHDGDFVGDPAGAQTFCIAPTGWVRASEGIDCNDDDPTVTRGPTWYLDGDGDGAGDSLLSTLSCAAPGPDWVQTGGDCNDTDPTRHPGRQEVCNGVDDDCDEAIDDDDLSVFGTGPLGYQDADDDGFGNASVSKRFCTLIPDGWRPDSSDCDDDDPAVRPGAVEICGNGIDDDCTGADEIPTWYADTDVDGYGAGPAEVTACDAPTPGSWTTNALDCDDSQATVNPEALELDLCDAIDQDCDGTAEPRLAWYLDADGDGFGDAATEQPSCTSPSADHVLQAGDCDDTDAGITFGRLWYLDADRDGLGDAAVSLFACPIVENGVEQPLWDDDDVQRSIFSGDCDDSSVHVASERPYFIDEDGDGYGSIHQGAVSACPASDGTSPSGLAIPGGDCVDREEDLNVPGSVDPAAIHPLAFDDPLVMDGEDNDCDGSVDTESTGAVWYADVDADGIGVEPALHGFVPGAVTTPGDCDDADSSVQFGRYWYTDLDRDGAGVGQPIFIAHCDANPDQLAALPGDCNDNDDAIGPHAAEICNGIDDDCSGLVDDHVPFVFPDADGDHATSLPPVRDCGQGHTRTTPSPAPDCDDADPDVYPGASEVCDGVDQDCDGAIDNGLIQTFYLDEDGDGATVAAGTIRTCLDLPPGYTTVPGSEDCDDRDAAVNLDSQEICGDGIDNNCSHTADDFAVTYTNGDGDAYGVHPAAIQACGLPGVAYEGGDCDDGDVHIHPDVSDLCDGIDNDCDGHTDEDATFSMYWVDADRDGYGDRFEPVSSCEPTVGLADNDLDCDDLNAHVSPHEAELACTGVDENCDGELLPDEHDIDADGFMVCEGDCDDHDARANPGEIFELCDGIDNNCDGVSISGDPDVTNPAAFVAIAAPVSHTYLARFEQGFTTQVIETCNPHLDSTFLMDGHPVFDIGLPDDVAGTTYRCFDDPTLTGALYARDEDGDGVPAIESTLEVGMLADDCVGPPAGFEPVASGLDCAPYDHQRWVLARAGQHADLDGDLAFGLLPLTDDICTDAVQAFGTDCNDFDPHAHSEFYGVVRNQTEFDDAALTCDKGTIILDYDSHPNFTWPIGAPLESATLTITAIGDQLCSAADSSGCLSSLEVESDFVDLTFRDIGLFGHFPMMDSILTLDRVFGIDLAIESAQHLNILDTHVENFGTLDNFITGSNDLRLTVTGATYVSNGSYFLSSSLHSGSVRNSTIQVHNAYAVYLTDGELDVLDSQLIAPVPFGRLFLLGGSAFVRVEDSDLHGTEPSGIQALGGDFQCDQCRLFGTQVTASTGSNLLFNQGELDDVHLDVDEASLTMVGTTLRNQGATTVNGTMSDVTLTDVVVADSDVNQTFLHANLSSTVRIDDLLILNPIDNGHQNPFLSMRTSSELTVDGMDMLGGSTGLTGLIHLLDSGIANLNDVDVRTRGTLPVLGNVRSQFHITNSRFEHDGTPNWLVLQNSDLASSVADVVTVGTGGTRAFAPGGVVGNGFLTVTDTEFHDLNTDNAAHFSGFSPQLFQRVRAISSAGNQWMLDVESEVTFESSLLQAPSPVLHVFSHGILTLQSTTVNETATSVNPLLDVLETGSLDLLDSLIHTFDNSTACLLRFPNEPAVPGIVYFDGLWVRHIDQIGMCEVIEGGFITHEPPHMEMNPDFHWANDIGVRGTYGEFAPVAP